MKLATLSVTFFLMLVSVTSAMAQGLGDFARISQAIGKEVVLVDREGLVREGVVESSTADNVKVRIGSTTHNFARQDVARIDRAKDGSEDGAAKGLLVGLVLGVLASQGSTEESAMRDYLIGVALYTGIGYAVDAMSVNRQPLYRAPASPSPTLKLSVRF